MSTVADAVEAVRRGQLIVLPTDTLYGIGADAFSASAVNALLAAKGRGRDMPVPVLIGAAQTLHGLANDVSEQARTLMDAFWPGALSLVFRHPPSLAWDLGDAAGTVLIRMPDHTLARELLTETGPLAVSSANRSGQPAALTVTEARVQLGSAVAVYLDGGPAPGSSPSTIVDVSDPDIAPRVLRLGGVTSEQLHAVLPEIVG